MKIIGFCSLVLLSAGLAAFSEETPTAQVVVFEFEPPDGTSFIEQLESTRERRVEGLAPRVDTSISRNSISIHRTPDGYLLEATPVSVAMTRDGRPVTDPIADLLMDVVVRYRLDSAGRIERVEGYEGLLERAAAIMPPGALVALSSVLSEDALTAREIVEWDRRIGDLASTHVRLGESIEAEDRSTMPDGTEVRFKSVTRFPGFEPCPVGECLRVEQIYDSDPERLETRLRLTPKGAGEELEAEPSPSESGPRIFGRASRLIDPATLLIYEETSSRSVVVKLQVPGLGEAPTMTREAKRYTYVYSPGA